ncbi:MAG: iron-sulfur cluster assembly scaffold protein [Phycisphaerae bacterium]|nr:iron-sulfur cluster assembly scaffold protein [Phycisphaerae bacterium]
MQYSDEVMNHFTNPRNVGSLDEKAADVGTGTFGSPACGDVLKLQIRVDGQGLIAEARFKTFGCGSAIASSSLLTEKITGKTLAQALELSNKEIARELQLPPIKVHCSVMAEEALKSAIEDYQAKNARHSGGGL